MTGSPAENFFFAQSRFFPGFPGGFLRRILIKSSLSKLCTASSEAPCAWSRRVIHAEPQARNKSAPRANCLRGAAPELVELRKRICKTVLACPNDTVPSRRRFGTFSAIDG